MKTSPPLHIHTPLIESYPLSQALAKQVFLKMENLQPAGSFKLRGIGFLCQQGYEQGVKHFVSSSGGNAGYAAAYAGRKLNIPTTVFVPKTTSAMLQCYIKTQGADVRIVGEVWDETHEAALNFAQKANALYISPFDHPLIWEGHATLVDEIVEEIGKPDAIILSVGGGGLFCGVMQGLIQHHLTDIPIVAVETEGTASLAASLKANQLVTLRQVTGVAKSLGAKKVARQAFDWASQYAVHSIVVSDAQAIDACIRFAGDHRSLVEPACGASLSIAYQGHPFLEGARRIVIIVCGGIGASLELMQEWKNMRESDAVSATSFSKCSPMPAS
ncbi:MAG: pyridoxal-phosphate dependent enzyme [Chloroflexota bacterium]